MAASRQPGGPPFVQVQTLILALGASASHGLLEALAAEQDRGRRLRLIELAASLGAAIVPETRRLLADPRWYVVRNMVLLLRRVRIVGHGRDPRSPITRTPGAARHPRALALDHKVPAICPRAPSPSRPEGAEPRFALGQHRITKGTDRLVEIFSPLGFLRGRPLDALKALRALAT